VAEPYTLSPATAFLLRNAPKTAVANLKKPRAGGRSDCGCERSTGRLNRFDPRVAERVT
jgi:hypothetical protein